MHIGYDNNVLNLQKTEDLLYEISQKNEPMLKNLTLVCFQIINPIFGNGTQSLLTATYVVWLPTIMGLFLL